MAFTYCTRLNSLVLGEGVETIGDAAFYGCCALNDIVIPNSVNSIGGDAFESCEQLKSITIGEGVETVGDAAFWGCSVISDIFVHSSIPAEIFENTFTEKNYKNATLHVPSGSLQNYVTAEYWQRFIHIVDDVEPSGILLPTTVEEPWMIFDINGKRWPHLKSGVNIIKYKNGETKKKYVQ